MKLLVCPVCRSKDIELDSGGYTGKYRCKSCGYTGSFVLEMDESAYKELYEGEEILKDAEKKKD